MLVEISLGRRRGRETNLEAGRGNAAGQSAIYFLRVRERERKREQQQPSIFLLRDRDRRSSSRSSCSFYSCPYAFLLCYCPSLFLSARFIQNCAAKSRRLAKPTIHSAHESRNYSRLFCSVDCNYVKRCDNIDFFSYGRLRS